MPGHTFCGSGIEPAKDGNPEWITAAQIWRDGREGRPKRLWRREKKEEWDLEGGEGRRRDGCGSEG
jgi:hypothetical protein